MLSTRTKIFLARSVSRLIVFGRHLLGLPDIVEVTRQQIRWRLNLREGIDFAIYLLGGFEVRTLRRYRALIRPGDVVLDIGANIGAHVLPLAQLVGDEGKVYAFEPTSYAFKTQCGNIALNPDLAPRIVARQVMLTASLDVPLSGALYSSWPLETSDDLHGDHLGRLMETSGATAETLDACLQRLGVQRVDFIKIDVDGHERDVLRGAVATLRRDRPQLMVELAPYVHADNPEEFDQLIREVTQLGYRLYDMATDRLLPDDPAGLRKHIPPMGGLNVLLKAVGQAGLSR